MDKGEDTGVGDERAAVRERSDAASADCERPKAAAGEGRNRIVGGAGYNRAFCGPESFAVKPQANACAAPTALGGLAHLVPKADALG